MKKFPIVLDLETKYTFREYSDPQKLGISVLGIYEYSTSSYQAFTEKELSNLFPRLENASYLIGFNINNFDLPVLQAYYAGTVTHFATFDILDDIKAKIGRRLALNDVIFATLGKRKNGHGLMAIDMYKEGRIEDLKNYCVHDVEMTKELFDFGVRHREIYYLDERGKVTIPVDWSSYLDDPGKSEIPLTLPF